VPVHQLPALNLRKKTIFPLILLLAAFALQLPSTAQQTNPLATLRSGHPRLFFHDSDLPAIKRAIAKDPFAKAYFAQQLAVGEKLLTLPPDTYRIEGSEHTLLATSRDMEGRVFTLAGLYRLTGDKRFADRATQEMLAAASFPDWFPTHFLDTGELTATLGLGYDWLYPVLSPADRATIENAIAVKGIDPWLQRIKSGDAIRHEHNNWNQVCNGGESIGALAIADEDPDRARGILDHAQLAIGNIMKLFAPDGGFEEGPGYWNYATSYNVLYIAALDSALGSDSGASLAPGFSVTPDYHFQSIGPSGQFANFGDAHPDIYPSPQVFWFARRFHHPAYAAQERPTVLSTTLDPGEQKESSRFAMLGLMWASLPPVPGDNTPLPLIESFARVSQAYLRSSWSDPNAWYVGFKGGDAHASHGHLDLGSFVLDAQGQRWASDLAGDSYGLPQYFGKLRWTYYRLRTEGHNTLTIDGQNEDLDANAPLIDTAQAGNTLFSIADLTSAYKAKLKSWTRGVKLLDKQRVLLQDEITPASAPVDVVWNFHTFAAVQIAADGRSATLTREGKTLQARILSPDGAKFSTASTQTPPPQEPNPGLTNLIISLPQQAAPATIAVLFTAPGDDTVPAIKPLSGWPLATLQPAHPRLFLHDADLPALKHAIATDPFVKSQFQLLVDYGNELLTTPPDPYVIGGAEHTLLDTSRDVEARVFALAGLYRLTGNKRYATRATQEMLSAAAFPDWYPTHFLDTGEMTATLGVGYDWLYSVLSPADRDTIEHAIAVKGIDPWIERINNGDAIHHEHNNWNQVCNGGETVGALAIADVDPDRAAAILGHARTAIADIMKLFAPDGGFEEGPTYWLYATSYNLLYIDALDTALGTDFGAANAPGFASTGDYHIQSDGPTYQLANFGDAGSGGAAPTAQMFWLAHRFDKPYYADHDRDIAGINSKPAPVATEKGEHPDRPTTGRNRFTLFTLLWSAQEAAARTPNSTAQLPLVQSFARVSQAYLRSAWSDPNAWYVAFKGGDAHASHGHLDLGAFVLDADGQRWASDLGPDSYGLPNYFGKLRFTYYRLRTEGHNTLTIDGQNQDLDSKSPLVATGTMGSTEYSIADLSQAYKAKLASWNRGVALIDGKRFLVQDELAPASAPVDVVWNFHTFAQVQIAPDGRSATLTENGKTLKATILAPATAQFSTASTESTPPQEPNTGLSNLIIPLKAQSGPQTIAVLFTQSGDAAAPTLKPLSAWQ